MHGRWSPVWVAKNSHLALSLVVIHNLDLVWFGVVPNETNPVLSINANTVLAFSIAVQPLQPITRGRM